MIPPPALPHDADGLLQLRADIAAVGDLYHLRAEHAAEAPLPEVVADVRVVVETPVAARKMNRFDRVLAVHFREQFGCPGDLRREAGCHQCASESNQS